MADIMKFLWGANSKIPARSNGTNGKAYFAIIDNGYTDTAAPGNEAFIYLDKAGARYNVIAKRAIFDSLGYKITNKYFSETNNSGSNTIQFFTAEQDPSKDTPIKSTAIISAIDLSNSSITASEYKIKTIINGFEDKTTGTNSTLSLGMASETVSGLMSAEDQVFGGSKTFTGGDFIVTNEGMINFDTSGFYLTGNEAVHVESPAINIQGNEQIMITTNDPGAMYINTSTLDIIATTAINGDASISGNTVIGGITRITDSTECNATNAAAALKVTGGVLIGKGMQVDGVATFANTTDASSTAGGVMVAGGIRVAKSAYIANNLTVAQAISNSRNATFNGSSVTNSYSTTIYGYLYGKNNATLSRSVVLNDDETADANTYTTTVKGAATFNKTVTIQDDIIINGDGVISGDLSVRGGDIYLGAAGDYATISYSADTITISFPS